MIHSILSQEHAGLPYGLSTASLNGGAMRSSLLFPPVPFFRAHRSSTFLFLLFPTSPSSVSDPSASECVSSLSTTTRPYTPFLSVLVVHLPLYPHHITLTPLPSILFTPSLPLFPFPFLRLISFFSSFHFRLFHAFLIHSLFSLSLLPNAVVFLIAVEVVSRVVANISTTESNKT